MAHSSDFSANDDQDIVALVQQYEQHLAQDATFFFESDTFQDIINYYDEHLETLKALTAIEHAIEQHPFCAQFYLAQAQILMDEERYQDAQDALDTALSYEPTNCEFLLAQADLLQRTQCYTAALQTLDLLRQIGDSDDTLQADILEATIWEAQQQYPRALQKLEYCVLHDPDNDWLLSRVWLCAEWADQRDQAICIYLKVIDQKPYSWWAWYHLGFAYMELELYEKAVEALDYAIVIDESFELAYRDIVAALLALEHYDEALRYLHDYSNRFELDAELYEFMGECYEGKGDSVLARSYYVQSAQLNVRDGNCYFRLGSCYMKENNWKSALAAFELAHQADSANELYCLALAEAHYEIGDKTQAREFLLLATQKAPQSAHVWLCFTEFHLHEQAFDEALDLLDRAALHCTDVFALDCAKTAILFCSGAYQEAFAELLRLHTLSREAPVRIAELSDTIEKHPLWLQWCSFLA